MTAKVEYFPEEPFEIDAKRGYLPFAVHDTCPECGKAARPHDCREDYICYPLLNGVERLWMCCPSCDHEWEIPVRLEIKVTLL